jgi:hypothetical protein
MTQERYYPVQSNVLNAKLLVAKWVTDQQGDGYSAVPGDVTIAHAGDGYYTATLPDQYPSGSILYADATCIDDTNDSGIRAYVRSLNPVDGIVAVQVQTASGTDGEVDDAVVQLLLLVRDTTASSQGA